MGLTDQTTVFLISGGTEDCFILIIKELKTIDVSVQKPLSVMKKEK